MKKIIKCELDCCDNCIYYNFDTGYCKKHRNYPLPYYTCDDFICFICNNHLKLVREDGEWKIKEK